MFTIFIRYVGDKTSMNFEGYDLAHLEEFLSNVEMENVQELKVIRNHE